MVSGLRDDHAAETGGPDCWDPELVRTRLLLGLWSAASYMNGLREWMLVVVGVLITATMV